MKELAQILRRLGLLFMALALLSGSAFGEISGVTACDFHKKNTEMNVYVRAFVPGRGGNFGSIGHFDLMIEGTVEFRGRAFVNPVFSYRMEDSRLDVFSERDSGKVYPHATAADYYYDCDIYQARMAVADQDQVEDFLKAIGGMVSSAKSHPSASGGLKCTIRSSSEFSKYRLTSVNCFYAVAMWMKGFGSTGLINYYYAAHRGECPVYTPAAIVDAFSGKFRLRYEA